MRICMHLLYIYVYRLYHIYNKTSDNLYFCLFYSHFLLLKDTSESIFLSANLTHSLFSLLMFLFALLIVLRTTCNN